MRRSLPPRKEFDWWVMAVPPLAWRPDGRVDRAANATLLRHMEAGGARTLMYGGNANVYHLTQHQLAGAYAMLLELAGESSWVIPSAGPDFGKLMDGAPMLRELGFPTAMMLPASPSISAGVARAARRFSDALGAPVIVYVKQPGYLTPDDAKLLVRDGVLLLVKYGVLAADLAGDRDLAALVDAIGPERVISGNGEMPAPAHLRAHPLQGFTTGSGCIAPSLSLALLRALRARDWAEAERLRMLFEPLESERERLGGIAVLHGVMGAIGLGEMGPIAPLLSDVPASALGPAIAAARTLLEQERAQRRVAA
jgi:dihydrodipicolinate synthase/N-acetylneuraminate lyase